MKALSETCCSSSSPGSLRSSTTSS
uniref:Uncharacterized protein n=1 Tax=Anguilla anguilla TaxID=7936 RepID=A0A0E9VEJ8_ANGAN